MLGININSIIPIMADYEILEGCRIDSFIYVNGGYPYRKDKDVKDIRYLRCTEFRVGCPGRAKFLRT